MNIWNIFAAVVAIFTLFFAQEAYTLYAAGQAGSKLQTLLLLIALCVILTAFFLIKGRRIKR
ncbi:hypothetical protein LX64_02363 [Chitinophaga skermanii]|uniref:Uncharacterized protein n=1 Tax=Chitinophaga skermanii TaxID=331697 RepID=A0A327QKZ4_9BACT|nr:hypothetical protein [Chitinophaga skermanii]RAJ05209.1 hypothetical protein LX64_02363 [Chitinophaga skermanii]